MSKKGDETSSGSTIVDVMSPFFISGSDNPNLTFTSDLLRDGNYADWADEMSNALYAKNKYGFVDGSLPIPKEDSSEFLLWKRCNAMVRGWLHSSMDKEIRASVKHAKTAREVWEDLQERFGSASAPRAYELMREITLTRQEKLSVSTYYTKRKGLWDEFLATSPIPRCKCGGCKCDISKQLTEMRDKERLYEFLMGLDEGFGTVKTQILSTRPMVSLGAAFHLVSEDERQKQITSSGRTNVEATAFQMQSARRQNRETGERRDSRREMKRCTHCGKRDHTIDECYEIIGYPLSGEKRGRDHGKREDSWKNPKNSTRTAHMTAGTSPNLGITADLYSKLVDYFSKNGDSSQVAHDDSSPAINMAGKINNLISWIIDSGATEHITCDSRVLKNQTKIGNDAPVKIPTGEKVHVVGVGDASLSNGLELNGVLNIPDFKCNLLSVSTLTRDLNCFLTFFPDFCLMQDLRSRKLIEKGRHRNGLYYLQKRGRGVVAMSVTIDSKTWHKRLGHASSLKSKHFDNNFGESGEHCDSCLRAKLTRLPFPSSSIRTTSCFELIHCDIC